ncbi:unnamed protein product [Orchesella dallaii]|uniref:Chitin-binding type-2 domain-containing protein n=1 Tax=Orchesella dallaii TaxID=48710 RepID=A0ABP1QWF8_9HEXA
MTVQYKLYTVAVLSVSSTRLLFGLITLLTILLGDGSVYAQSRGSVIDPCSTKSGTAPHDTHCDKYFACSQNVTSVVDCPNGLVYIGGSGRSGRGNQLFGSCEYDFNVDCSGRPERNPPIGTEHCDWLYGIFGHETSCTRYWTCWNGTATEQLCIGGLLYNEDTHACDWPENVPGCQKHPLCKEDPNGNVPLGKSCNRYWSCQGGYPRLQRCPAMLVFDKKSLRCVVPPTEDCDVPSTTPPPPEEEEDKPREQQQQRPNQNRNQGGSRPQVQASQLRQSAAAFESQQNAASSYIAPQIYQPQQQEYSDEEVRSANRQY